MADRNIALSLIHIKGICEWPTEPPTTTTEAPPFTTSIDPGTTAGPPGQYQSIFPHFFNFRNLFGSESFL